MIKKILSRWMLVAICFVAFFSCKKVHQTSGDATRNYFPLKFGKYVTYAVDSIYYFGSAGIKIEVKSQMKYVITDTFTDSKRRLSYLMDVYSRPYDGALWVAHRVITITPTTTPVSSLLYTQDGTQYVKLMFPVTEGTTWPGNQYAQWQDTSWAYLKNWTYAYSNIHFPYFNGYVNFDNTVTVLEDNENVNYQNVDSAVAGYNTFAKEVYAYNVGMIYKEWTHTTWIDSAKNRSGYSVVMQAIDHN
jgi:hypothetical protein